ncbi:MAG: hypothetical protein WB676_05710 [Bryobacteraceae bacterium]
MKKTIWRQTLRVCQAIGEAGKGTVGDPETGLDMGTQQAILDRAWRFLRLALSLAVISVTVWAAGPLDAPLDSVIQPLATQPDVVEATSSPSLAFGRYIASLGRITRPAEWQTVTVEIEASLPGLAKRGRLEAIRRNSASGRPEYQVLHVEGDSIVKQEVIARDLMAEKEADAIPKASVAVSPANYKFRYVGSIASPGRFVYVYQVTPKKKRTGLMEGQLWIDAETGLAVHQGGHLVKKPSIFVRRVELVRDTQFRDGVPDFETTRLAIDTRLVGRAELTIREHPYADSDQVIGALRSSAGVQP